MKLTPEQILEFEVLIHHKLNLLAVRARDPEHPMHALMAWDENGRAVTPSDTELMARLLAAALNEPEPH
jgi:hypothetical protein